MFRERLYFILLLFIIIISGCKINEPERYYNKVADKDFNAQINLEGRTQNDVFCGSYKIPYNFDSLNFEIDNIFIYLDGEYYTETNEQSGTVRVYTKELEDGNHKYEWYVVPKEAGIITASQLPVLVFEYSFIVDNTPPTPVEFTEIKWGKEHPLLSWSKNTDENFDHYLLVLSNHFVDGGMKEIKIYNQNITTYSDTSMPIVIGDEVSSYAIKVFNGYQYSNYDQKSIDYGNKFHFPSKNVEIIKNKNSCICFADQLYEISLEDESIIQDGDYSINIGAYGSWYIDYENNYILANSGEKSGSGRTVVYDLSTLNYIAVKTDLGNGNLVMPYSKDKIYLYQQTGYGTGEGLVRSWNLVDYNVSSMYLKNVSEKTDVGVETFDREFYFILYWDMLVKFQIKEDNAQLIDKINFGSDFCTGLYSYNGNLYVTCLSNSKSKLLRINPENLKMDKLLELDGAVTYACFSQNTLSLGFSYSYDSPVYGIIKNYKIDSMTEERKIFVNDLISKILLTNDAKIIYVFGSNENDAWIIKL